MKQFSSKLITGCFLIWVMIAVLVFSCLASGEADSVMSRIKQAQKKLDPDKQVTTAIPIPENIIRVKEPYQGGTFYTLPRKNEISRFKCSSCHGDKKVTITNAAAMSHDDIKVNHGPKDGPFSCNTCHSKEDRDLLISSDEKKIDFDHVYNMCGQCHFRQKKDWVGGAHGKREKYWAGKRVVYNCTSCHNPHSPKFKKQWPATYSVPLK